MHRDFSSVSTPALVDEITTLAGHLNAAHARFLALIGELNRRGGWAECGVKSCAHWLSWKCGIDLGAAREKVRTARALAALPQIAVAMADGRLSYAKVRALTRVADASTEATLLAIALCGTASHVEQVVRSYRRALDAEELSREAAQQRNQCLWFFTEPDGSMTIRGRLPAEIGALFVRALQAAEDGLPLPKHVSAETSDDDLHRLRSRRVEALTALAETFQQRKAGRCELEHGPSIAAETARRLACDSSVVRIVETEKSEPLDVGRRTRTIPPGIRRALNARDKGCRFPGRSFKRYVDGHHVKHWANGGETKLSNFVTLCRFHHRLVHEGQVVVQSLDDGAFRFVKPRGESFDSPLPEPTEWRDLVAANEATGTAITSSTALTLWCGERLDLGLALECLFQRRAEGISAGTSSGVPTPP